VSENPIFPILWAEQRRRHLRRRTEHAVVSHGEAIRVQYFQTGAHFRFMLVPRGFARVDFIHKCPMDHELRNGIPRSCQNTVNNCFPLKQKGMSSAQTLCLTTPTSMDHSERIFSKKTLVSREMTGRCSWVKNIK
jgi:hypothetical protein